MSKVVLVNDTSLFNTHFGCQLVGQTIREQCARVGLNIISSLPLKFDLKLATPWLRRADLVIINGEGSMHHRRHTHLLKLADDYPCALVNCVYQENGDQPSLRNFLYLSARESLSANEIHSRGVDCQIVPDLIFASTLLRSIVAPPANLPLGITDNVTNPLSGFSPKSELVYDTLLKIRRCQTLCAGRFHAAIAAAVMGIPFSTWESNTWKTQGMMQDIGIEHLHFSTLSQAVAAVPSTLDPKVSVYVKHARKQIRTMFNQLSEIASEISQPKQSKAA